MKQALAFILIWFSATVAAVGQTTYKLNELPELAAEPASTDWFLLWDTSAATSKKISRANLLTGSVTPEALGLTDPGADRILFWDDSASAYKHLIIGDNLLITDTTLSATVSSSDVALPEARIAFGNASGILTSEAGFEYDPLFNILKVPTMITIGSSGAEAAISANGSGIFTFFNNFTDESILLNLGASNANTATITSDSGVNLFDFGTIDIKVPTEVYDATGWNGDTTVPTKDAVRDKIEALSLGGASLTANYVGYGDGSNVLTGEAAFSYNSTTNILTAGGLSAATVSASTSVTSDSLFLVETEGSGTQTLEFYAQSDYSSNRRFGIAGPDSDIEITFPASITVAGINYANSWGDGIKQTFNPSGTTAGINVGAHTADPSSPANGDLWYDSTANELTARINGANVALGAGGGGGTLTATYVGYGDGSNALTGESVFNYNSTTNTLTVPNLNSSSGTTTIGPLQTSDGKNLLNDRSVYTSVASGGDTAYTLTNTAAAVDNGTDDPVLTIDSAGTYLIHVRAQVDYSAATVSAETATIKLRRTNNTATDVTGATTTIDLPVATTLTHTYGIVELPPVLYTTLNSDDSLTIFANVSATLGAGSIKISEASIVAVRIR